jgi:hypothetical protein
MAAAVTGQSFYEWPGGPAVPPLSKFYVTCDNSYATGGYFLDKALFGYPGDRDVFVVPGMAKVGATYYRAVWDDDNQKLVILQTNGAEVPNATDLSALVIKVLAIGVQ